MDPLPEDFVRLIRDGYGERGRQWLADLPRLLSECQQRWSLRLQPAFPLSYNYVAPAVRADGLEVVLKAGVINPELLTEIAALRHYNGRGSVQLLDADPDWGVMLLERIRPGTPLATLTDDERATAIAAEVMQQLWQPPPPDPIFPSVHKWAAGMLRLRAHFNGGTGPLPTQLVEQAETLFAELLSSMAEPVLLHGDLHHWNIIAAQRQPWLALDPKGIVGEPAYEVGAFLRNPTPDFLTWPDLNRVLARRVDQLSEQLGFDRQRLIGWGIAQAVLSAWWSIEDQGYGWEPAIQCAETLAALPGA
jgi:streptomycin 6-kinase